MQKLITQIIQTAFKGLEFLAPQLSSRLALWLFFRPLKTRRPNREEGVYETAKRFQRTLAGFYPRQVSQSFYVGYEWGEGPTVLLVHGWAGRATQFQSLIPTLVKAGYKVVSFDAPAHGDTPGKRTNLLEFGEILRDLSSVYGDFSGIVAHSFGAVAAIRSLTLDQLPAKSLTTIGAPAKLDFILEGFCQQIHITARSLGAIKKSLNELAEGDREDFSFLTHLPALEQPLLIVHDTDDRSVSYEQGQMLANTSPDSVFVSTSGLGHNRILSDADVGTKLLEHLESVR